MQLGIPARDADPYGTATLLQRRQAFAGRTMTLDEARVDFR